MSKDIVSDSDLARELGVSRQSLEGWKKNDKIPVERIVSYCLKNGLNIKFILTGKNGERDSGSSDINKIITEEDAMGLFMNDPIAAIAALGGKDEKDRAMGALLEIYSSCVEKKLSGQTGPVKKAERK